MSLLFKFLHKIFFCVKPEALSRAGATSTPCSLLCRCFRDRGYQKRLHADTWVVHLLLGETRIDNVHNAIYSEGRLGNVRGYDDLPPGRAVWDTRWGCRIEYSLLLVRWQRRVEGDARKGSDSVWVIGS